jgi:hypothetical protein
VAAPPGRWYPTPVRPWQYGWVCGWALGALLGLYVGARTLAEARAGGWRGHEWVLGLCGVVVAGALALIAAMLLWHPGPPQ